MKKVLFIVGLLTTGLIFMNFSNPTETSQEETATPSIEIPENVSAILDNSCMGCHNSESKNLKGKKKLSFDKLNDLQGYKAIGKYTDIAEVIVEGDMPPKKFLSKYPERALSEEDQEILVSWAKDAAKGLSGE